MVYSRADDDDELPEVDELFSQVPLPSDFDVGPPQDPSPSSSLLDSTPDIRERADAQASRFGPLVSASDIVSRQKASVPANTRKNSNWAMNVWRDWAEYRSKQNPSDAPSYILTMGVNDVDKWLSRFVLEVRRKDGKVYPPNSLHQLCCGLLRSIREYNPAIDFFKSPEFASFRKILDAEMKRIKSDSTVQTHPKRAEPILQYEEDLLWKNGVLGSHSPQSLVDTMVFMSGLYFALRSGEEHRSLSFSSVELVEKEGSIPYLIYTETVSKNNPGGLKHRKVEPKQVKHFANSECPEHCFVEMYKKYCLHRPENVTSDAFYLAPLSNPKNVVWYKNQPIGVHTLSNTVKRLCRSCGISGYKTNHSLRVTTAT